ncbi:type VI secretion system baseplate subunit TssE, partial [Klebsiella pneumoniae]|nr:type VI secretion system baseplate subunit TssE [Klebsiella pneumoniae]
MHRHSLYDILYVNFAGGLDQKKVSETDQVIRSLL